MPGGGLTGPLLDAGATARDCQLALRPSGVTQSELSLARTKICGVPFASTSTCGPEAIVSAAGVPSVVQPEYAPPAVVCPMCQSAPSVPMATTSSVLSARRATAGADVITPPSDDQPVNAPPAEA